MKDAARSFFYLWWNGAGITTNIFWLAWLSIVLSGFVDQPGLKGILIVLGVLGLIRSFFVQTGKIYIRGEVVTKEQWKEDCGDLMTAWMYGNPPGGWSDPRARKEFQDKINDIERRLRDEA